VDSLFSGPREQFNEATAWSKRFGAEGKRSSAVSALGISDKSIPSTTRWQYQIFGNAGKRSVLMTRAVYCMSQSTSAKCLL
jgi:hypothetical protein